MMSILSGVVLMVAIGTVVQNSEQLKRWFAGESQRPKLIADEIEVQANDLAMIDVLANDQSLAGDARTKLVITAQPDCGRVFVQSGRVQYLPDGNCIGRQEFAYGLKGSDLEPVAVNVRVAPEGRPRLLPKDQRIAKPEPAPQGAPEVEAGAGPVALAEPATAAGALALGAAAAAAAPAGGKAAPAAPQATAPAASGSGPAAPGRPSLAAVPSAPVNGGEAEQPGPAIAGAGAGGNHARGNGAPGPLAAEDPSIGDGAPSAPAAVQPRTDLATLLAPATPAGSEPAGRAAQAPVPVARPESPAVAATGDAADPGRATVTAGAPRPTEPAAPGSPDTAPAEGDTAVAAVEGAAGRPRTAAPDGPDAPAALLAAAGSAPERLDSDPVGDSEPAVSDAIPGLAGAWTKDEDGFQVSEVASEEAGGRTAPATLGMTPSMALARIEVPSASAAPDRAAGLAVDLGSGVERIERPEPPQIGAGADSEIALAEPGKGLEPVLGLGDALRLAPVDTSDPPLLAEPGDPAAAEPTATLATAALAPAGGEAAPATDEPPVAEAAPERVAALPRADETCMMPPDLTLQPGPAAITTVLVSAPCHAGSAAALNYGELSLGLALDEDGEGRIDVPGFETRQAAEIAFADGTELDFTLPFDGIERVERVALGWQMPVRLDLHALEFGAATGDTGHVHPDNPRSYDEVRRSGGGFLQSFDPVAGAGDHVRVYSHYIRRGGSTGIVKMMIDFASRRERQEGTCGEGELAAPGFTVQRSTRGLVERPLRSRLAALDCGSVTDGEEQMIGNAVANMVITY